MTLFDKLSILICQKVDILHDHDDCKLYLIKEIINHGNDDIFYQEDVNTNVEDFLYIFSILNFCLLLTNLVI